MNSTLAPAAVPDSNPVSTTVPATAPGAPRWQRWAREPLLHFLLLGGLVFAADHWLVGKAKDPRTIVISAAVDDEVRTIFKSSRGQDPTAEQLTALRQAWLDNEVLYREGLALGVDQGDATIRDRVIFKALGIVESNLNLPAFDDKTLRAWFEAHRDRYDEPLRFDFQEAVLTGDNSEGAVRAFVNELNRGTSGELKAGLRLFKGRPQASLAPAYGEAFGQQLGELPPGEWRAMSTREGWRAIRLDAVTRSKPADFAVLRGVVQQDWTDATMAELRTAAVRQLARKYTVQTAPGGPAAKVAP